MKRNLSLVLVGLLALGVQGQNSGKKTPEIKIDEQRRTIITTAANYYKSAAEGYLEAAKNKIEIIQDYETLISPIEERIKANTETNYPAAWITVATYKKTTGTLEEQIGNNKLLAGVLFEKAHAARLELGENIVSLLDRRNSLDYQIHYSNSREDYTVSKKYFEEAGDKLNATIVTELMAKKDALTGDLYKSILK